MPPRPADTICWACGPKALQLVDGQAPGTVAVDLVAVTPLNEKSCFLSRWKAVASCWPRRRAIVMCRVATGPSCLAVDLDAVLLFERDSGRRFIPAGNIRSKAHERIALD